MAKKQRAEPRRRMRSVDLGSIADGTSEQRSVRKMLRGKSEILQAIFDNIPVMISFHSPAGRLLLVNREWERVLGWTLEEAQRIDVVAEFYPEPRSQQEVAEFIRRAEKRWAEFKTRARDGRTIDTAWMRLALSDGSQIGLGLDVTERKRLEREVKARAALLAEGEKMSHTGSWAFNLASGALSCSEETFRIFGLEPGQEAPSHELFTDLFQLADRTAAENTILPADRSANRHRFLLAIAGRTDFEANHRIVRPDGSVREVHIVGHLVFSEFGELLEYVGVVMDVTKQHRAEERLRQSHDELRALSARLRAVREEESARIAREVHDEIGQMLTALQLDVAWLASQLRSSRPVAREDLAGKLQSMAGLIDSAAHAVNRITTELRPGVLDQLGLEAAVEWYVDEFTKRTGISCRFRSSLDAAGLVPAISTALFRILQEALTNVARHSAATEVQIHLAAEQGRILLAVSDNGSGIPEDKIGDSRSLGLLGMRERARSLGGNVVIHRTSDQGTTVQATIPQ